MRKILVFTDLHLLPEGETLIGLDPGARLRQGLGHALRNVRLSRRPFGPICSVSRIVTNPRPQATLMIR